MSVDPRPVVLIGFMASGKTTAGRRAAALLGREFLDLDDLVGAMTGRTPAELIRNRGEAAFRRAEAAALDVALATRSTIVATGGGAVLAPRNRKAIARGAGGVFWLRVTAGEVLRRSGQERPSGDDLMPGPPDRPLLPAGADEVRQLLESREPAYAAVATGVIDTDGLAVEDVASRVVEAVDPAAHRAAPDEAGVASLPGSRALTLACGPEGHGPVMVGPGLLGRVAELPDFPRPSDGKVLMAADPLALGLYGERVLASLRSAGLEVFVHNLPAGEAAKTITVLRELWEAMVASGLGRGGLVVSLGGGAASDAAGFAAATYMRGVRVVHLPTTLLAQVDASVGGKTAIDLPEGKNLVGLFHFPALVVADPTACRTLPQSLLAEGLVELAKTLLVSGEPIGAVRDAVLARAGQGTRGSNFPDSPPAALVARAVEAKLALVRRDPFDRGPRMALNLGHTFGHAVEAAAGYGRIRHGLAVGVGVLAAARLSGGLGLLDRATCGEVAGLAAELLALFPARTLRKLAGLDEDRVGTFLQRDKKKDGSAVTYVVLEQRAGGRMGAVRRSDVPPRMAMAALESALAEAGGAARPRTTR